MKKILELNNIANLDISGGMCRCFCFSDEYENHGQLLKAINEPLPDKDTCVVACMNIKNPTVNSHCEDLEYMTKSFRITSQNF